MKWLYRLIPVVFLSLLIPFNFVYALPAWDDTDYPYRYPIVIDADQIDAALEDFPVYIEISATSGIGDDDITHIFDIVEDDYGSIAVYSGGELCYVEVVEWDDTSEYAELHVKVPDIASDVDTTIYLYYGAGNTNSYVGLTGSAAAQNVWDDNFVFVSHMNDNPAGDGILDSTSNANHGTKKGVGEPVEVAGLAGKAQDYDNTDDYIDIGDFYAPGDTDPWTAETLLNNDDTGGNFWLGSMQTYPVFYNRHDLNRFRNRLGAYIDKSFATIGTDFGYYTYVASGDDTIRLGIDGSESTADTVTGTYLGRYLFSIIGNGYTGNTGVHNGLIDETRISNTARSAGWIKATNATLRDNIQTVGTQDIYPLSVEDLSYSNLYTNPNSYSALISWTNPIPEIEVTVVRNETWYPTEVADGETRYSGSLESFTDNFTPGEATYYYSVFSTTDFGTNEDTFATLLLEMPATPAQVGGNMMFIIIPIVIALGIIVFAFRANIKMGEHKIKPDIVMRGIAIGLVALIAILALLGVI